MGEAAARGAAGAKEGGEDVKGWLSASTAAATLPAGPGLGGTLWKASSVSREEPRRMGSAGSEDARFEVLFAEQSDAVGRLCRRMLGRDGAAEDAAQEVFLRAQRGFPGYDPTQSFRGWLLAITSHYCIDVLRKRSREGRLFTETDFDPGDLGSSAPGPLGHAIESEQRARLLEAVEALPTRYRVPLVLRYFQDLDYAAIAETLGVSRDNVGVLLFRARRKLRESLEEIRA